MNIVHLEVQANFHGFSAWNTHAGMIHVRHPFAPPSVRKRTYELNGKEATREECAMAMFNDGPNIAESRLRAFSK